MASCLAPLTLPLGLGDLVPEAGGHATPSSFLLSWWQGLFGSWTWPPSQAQAPECLLWKTSLHNWLVTQLSHCSHWSVTQLSLPGVPHRQEVADYLSQGLYPCACDGTSGDESWASSQLVCTHTLLTPGSGLSLGSFT